MLSSHLTRLCSCFGVCSFLHFGRVWNEADATESEIEQHKELVDRKEKIIDAQSTKVATALAILLKFDAQSSSAAEADTKSADGKSGGDAKSKGLNVAERSKWESLFRDSLHTLRTVWVDVKANAKDIRKKPLSHALWYEVWLRSEWGTALKTLNEWLADYESELSTATPAAPITALRETAEKMRTAALTKLAGAGGAGLTAGWSQWLNYDKVWHIIKNPNEFRPH